MEHEQPPAKKGKTMLSFFKRIDKSSEDTFSPIVKPSPISSLGISSVETERDPGKRKKICQHPVNLQNEIRRAYMRARPYQPILKDYPKTKFGNHDRRFRPAWFKKYTWLEYSPSTNKAYCFPCFLFLNDCKPSTHSALVNNGFHNWKRVNGKDCAFLCHVGSTSESYHNRCMRKVEDLMKSSQHIGKVMLAQTGRCLENSFAAKNIGE